MDWSTAAAPIIQSHQHLSSHSHVGTYRIIHDLVLVHWRSSVLLYKVEGIIDSAKATLLLLFRYIIIQMLSKSTWVLCPPLKGELYITRSFLLLKWQLKWDERRPDRSKDFWSRFIPIWGNRNNQCQEIDYIEQTPRREASCISVYMHSCSGLIHTTSAQTHGIK